MGALPAIGPALGRGIHLLTGLDQAGLRAAIEGPAHLAGLRLEPGLVELVLRDAAGTTRRPPPPVARPGRDVGAAGGAHPDGRRVRDGRRDRRCDRPLGRERVPGDVAPSEQDACRSIMLRLIERDSDRRIGPAPADGGAAARRPGAPARRRDAHLRAPGRDGRRRDHRRRTKRSPKRGRGSTRGCRRTPKAPGSWARSPPAPSCGMPADAEPTTCCAADACSPRSTGATASAPDLTAVETRVSSTHLRARSRASSSRAAPEPATAVGAVGRRRAARRRPRRRRAGDRSGARGRRRRREPAHRGARRDVALAARVGPGCRGPPRGRDAAPLAR